MILKEPAWLLLLIPVAASFWWLRGRGGLVDRLRLVLMLLLVLALTSPTVVLPSRTGRVIVVADRSASMPRNADVSEKEAVELIQKARHPDSRLGVVSFGEGAAVDLLPDGGAFAGFSAAVGRDGSNLDEALTKALSLLPKDSPGRVLVLSDGRYTGPDPSRAAFAAAARGIPIDVRPLSRPAANDVALDRFEAPGSVAPGEAFLLDAWVRSPIDQEVTYELRSGDRVVAAGKRVASTGLTRLTFRDRAEGPGTNAYRLSVTSTSVDPVPENNTAKALVGIRGKRPLLCVGPAGSGLVKLLGAGGLDVVSVAPDGADLSLDALSGVSAVLLENVAATKLGDGALETLDVFVRERGAGLFVTGGKNAYGPGGYYKSPIEKILPVSMELRQEHRKLSLAIVVALDRSGSMAVSAGGGRTKMDLADLSTVQVLDLLSPMDEFGVIAVDSMPHTIVNLEPVADRKVRSRILRIESMGGGIFIFEALRAAAEMIQTSKAGARHILLFADAADSEEPGAYKELLARLRTANVTVSVVGLGTDRDSDAELLRDIARRGEGNIYFTNDPEKLPQIFAQDTFVVARSAFIEETTPFELTSGLTALTRRAFGKPPAVGGYNLCYLREGANLAAVSKDEYTAPLVASWQAGAGRVVAFTGEADGAHAGPLARWADVGELHASLARYTIGDRGDLPDGLFLAQSVENGVVKVELFVDPKAPPIEPPAVTVLRGRLGETPSALALKMEWTAPDRLTASVPLRGSETALATVDVPGAGRHTLSPVCLPYSPEYRPAAGSGVETLARLARATGGVERVDLTKIWDELPKRPREAPLAPWLLLASAALLLVEVLERRTALLSGALRMPRRKERAAAEAALAPSARGTAVPSKPLAGGSKPTSSPAAPPAPGAPSAPSMVDALQQARRKAKDRTDK